MTNLVVRKATRKDIPAIVRVRRVAFTEEEVRGFALPKPSIFYFCGKMEEAWDEENLLKDGWSVFLAEDRGEIVGFIVFKVENGMGYIDNINVTREQQGKGIGRALVLHAERVVKSQGSHVMHTDTTENAEGIAWKSYFFWTKMGYKETGERIPTEWDFKEIRFVKILE